jgi:hypothetical protein
VQWTYERNQRNTLPELFDNVSTSAMYEYSAAMLSDFNTEYRYNLSTATQEPVRTIYGGYVPASGTTIIADNYLAADRAFVWKYLGSTYLSEKRSFGFYDPNFIIYRVADVMLMKAEALILQEKNITRWETAIDLINQVRLRSNLAPMELSDDDTELSLLQYVLHERKMELAGEGKIWYDILRMGRRNNNIYKNEILVNHVLEYNLTNTTAFFRSTLSGDDALFLPIWDKELEANELLIQNLHYK